MDYLHLLYVCIISGMSAVQFYVLVKYYVTIYVRRINVSFLV